jgi:hypothetical protein
MFLVNFLKMLIKYESWELIDMLTIFSMYGRLNI